jgi:hypothetical protein
MTDYTIDDIDYAEQDAVLEVDGINVYFQFSKEPTLAEAIAYLKKDRRYWQDKAMNLEYDKTLTGDRAV